MATKPVVAVFDGALKGFLPPFVVPAIGLGLRSFQDEVNKKGADAGPVAQHPEDFELFHVADFDEETGRFVQADGLPRSLMRGKDALKAE